MMNVLSAKPFALQFDKPIQNELHRNTYWRLRSVMTWIAILLPVVLFVSSNWIEMQPSISDFYHTIMRDVFVGSLFAIGICLCAYKGYNNLEDTCLTAAGGCLFVVALAPTPATPNPELYSEPWIYSVLHFTSASCFFLLLAIVCIFANSHGLEENEKSSKCKTGYKFTAFLMIGLVVATVSIRLISGSFQGNLLFWLETAGIWIFAAYWILKSYELSRIRKFQTRKL